MPHRLAQLLLYAFVAWTLLLSVGAAADQEQSLISVTGSGTVTTKPDVVEIVGVVTGQSELAGDALAKFRSVKQAVMDALQGLAITGLKIEARAFSVGTAVPSDHRASILLRAQQGQAAEQPMVAIQETLKIRIAGIDKLTIDDLLLTIVKVVDAGQEAGIVFARPLTDIERISSRGTAPNFTSFALADTERPRQRAFELAMESARAEARRLAGLAGVQVGEVYSIHEIKPPTYVPSSLRNLPDDTSPTLSQIQETVTLSLSFKLKCD